MVLELERVVGDAGKTLDGALRQLRERDYATELRERGRGEARPLIELGAAFDGKRRGWRGGEAKKQRVKASGPERRGRRTGLGCGGRAW